MGHSDIGVTLNAYTHLGLEDAADELKRMEELADARKKLEKVKGENLQIKVSLYGSGYIVNDLETNRYEVPMVYFPIYNDFERIVDRLIRDRKAFVLDPDTGEYRDVIIGDDIVDIRAFDYDAFKEVKD